MKTMQKWAGIACTIVMGAGLVAGCGSSTSNTNTGNSGPVTLKLGMWSSSPAEKALVDKQVAAFEQANPNIKVTEQVVTGDYMQALQPMLASHTAPDIFYVDASVAPQLESSGALMALDDYIKKDNVDVSDFSPSLLKSFQWQGKTYGFPKDFNTLSLEYNQDLLAKAGISSPPSTFEELQQDAAKLKAKNIVPLSMPIDVARYYPFVVDMGGSYYDAANNKATFTDASNEAGLKFFMDNLQQKNFVTPKDLGADWAGVPFSQGKVAMVLEGAWLMPFMQQTAPNMKFGVADFPSLGGKNDNMTYTVSYSMSKATKHPDEAAKLLFYMTGKDAQKMTAESGLAMPARSSEQDVFLQKYPSYKPFVDGVANAVPYQFGTLGQNFVDAINKATEAGVLKKMGPVDVLKQADQALASQQ